jgi:SAM-dependent methyltransferase
MIKQWLRKRAKIVYGLLNTYIRKKRRMYNDATWWDAHFYTDGVSDRQTLSPRKSVITAKYHYASMELQILKHLRNNEIAVSQATILDIGSGSGHWIDFYSALEPRKITGIDVSASAYNFLRKKYNKDSRIEIHQGRALEFLGKTNERYDIVNAVGVMFHIVDDSEWRETIHAVGGALKKGGLFVVGGHFGSLDGLNVQTDKDGYVNKRLRSRGRWMLTLKEAGFANVKIYRNNAYLWINDTLPENNVLIATK